MYFQSGLNYLQVGNFMGMNKIKRRHRCTNLYIKRQDPGTQQGENSYYFTFSFAI